MEDIEPYQISDTPLAAYLYMRGMTLLTTVPDKADWKRKVYVFVDDPNRELFVEEFKNDVGSFHSYWVSLKTVQRKLYDK